MMCTIPMGFLPDAVARDMIDYLAGHEAEELGDYVVDLVRRVEESPQKPFLRSRRERNRHLLHSHAVRLAEGIFPLVRYGGYKELPADYKFHDPQGGELLTSSQVVHEVQAFLIRFMHFLLKYEMAGAYYKFIKVFLPVCGGHLVWGVEHDHFAMLCYLALVHAVVKEAAKIDEAIAELDIGNDSHVPHVGSASVPGRHVAALVLTCNCLFDHCQ